MLSSGFPETFKQATFSTWNTGCLSRNDIGAVEMQKAN
jgi:hypothetical protein